MKYFKGLLEKARRGVIRYWSVLALLVAAVGVMQLLLGRFAEVESSITWWLVVHLVPGSVLLYGGLRNRQFEAPLFPIGALRLAKGLILLYLLLCLFTLLYIPVAVQVNRQPLTAYMSSSYWWLAIIHVFLLIWIARLMIRKELDPAEAHRMILKYVKEAREQALGQQKLVKARSLELILNGKIEDAIDHLKFALKDTAGAIDHVVVISGTYRNMEKARHKEGINETTVQETQNVIIYSLIDLIETIDH